MFLLVFFWPHGVFSICKHVFLYMIFWHLGRSGGVGLFTTPKGMFPVIFFVRYKAPIHNYLNGLLCALSPPLRTSTINLIVFSVHPGGGVCYIYSQSIIDQLCHGPYVPTTYSIWLRSTNSVGPKSAYKFWSPNDAVASVSELTWLCMS